MSEILSYVTSGIAIISALWAVRKAGWEINFRAATKHLGDVCCDRDMMGYFEVEMPSFLTRYLFPFWIAQRKAPKVPTISGLIKAGDEGIYTSAMFDWTPPNYDRVSWKPLYQAFFQELWWWKRFGDLKKTSRISRTKQLRQYVLRAKSAVDCQQREAQVIIENKSMKVRGSQRMIGQFD